MSHEDRETVMKDNFEAPLRGKTDEGEFDQHNLKDQIAMDKHLAAKGNVGSSKFLGCLVRKISPPGTI